MIKIKPYFFLAYHIINGLYLFIKMNFGNHRRIADRRLRYLVKYAYENVELYRRKYDAAGIKPSDINNIDDLSKLPLITKRDIVEGYPNDIVSKKLKPGDYYMVSTSGSTGIPVRIFKDRRLLSISMVMSIFMNKLIGLYLGIKIKPKTLLSIFVETPDSLEGIGPTEKKKLPSFCFKHSLDINALDPPQTHIEKLNSFKPDTVFTYPSIFRNMVTYAEHHNLSLHQPALLVVSGELLDKHTRKIIKRGFKGELLNWYITTECSTIASECKCHAGMHIKDNTAILELLKDGKPVSPGEVGEVVITNLWNKATPIIRYSGLKDIGRISPVPCKCKQKTPLLEVLEGRITDSVVLNDGDKLHPFSLTLALEHIQGIISFQIIQETLNTINVLIVAENKGTSQLAEAVRDSLQTVICNRADISTCFVDDIPHLSNGQSHRVVVSKIAQQLYN
jgi:phenylacetate-CoA ligase